MEADLAATRIQLAWRFWQNRRTGSTEKTTGRIGCGCLSDLGEVIEEEEEEEAAQATSGYMSASSASCGSVANIQPQQTPPQPTPQAPLPRRSWTALPLNLHQFGDSSADSSPGMEPLPLSVGASRTDLSAWLESPCVLRRDGGAAKVRDGQHWHAAETTMQLCYRNDAASDSGAEEPAQIGDIEDSAEDEHKANSSGSGGEWQRFCRPSAMLKDSEGSRSQQINGKSASLSMTRRPLEPELLESLGLDCNHEIMSVHSRLRDEAWLALVQAKPMARMQLRIDSCYRDKCKSGVGVESPGGCSCSWGVTAGDLAAAGPAALRMLRAHMLHKIEACNRELVNSLVERDDLNMEQDSLLIEIEDLTRRAHEAARQLPLQRENVGVTTKLQNPVV